MRREGPTITESFGVVSGEGPGRRDRRWDERLNRWSFDEVLTRYA